MAKMERSKVGVTNAKNGKRIEVVSTQTPRNNEVGVYFYAKLNHLGIAYLQQKADVTDTKSFEELIGKTFGIPAEGFGNLAELSPETQSDWVIDINGIEWHRTMTKAELKRAEKAEAASQIVAAPVVAPTPVIVEQPAQMAPAVADKTELSEEQKMEGNVKIAKDALSRGLDPKALKGALMKKYNEAYADKIMQMATAKEAPMQPQIPDLSDLFSAELTPVEQAPTQLVEQHPQVVVEAPRIVEQPTFSLF